MAKIKNGTNSVRQIVIIAVAIIAVGIAVAAAHWPGLSAKAFSFDDIQYLVKNPLVQNPGWSSARRFLTEVLEPSTVDGYYQPLAMISLMLDYAAGGRVRDLLPFHRTSLCLHVANTALVIVLLYLLFGEPFVAAMAGLLFGLHPMTVESIPWVSERKTLLAAMFALWCLVFYVLYTRKGSRPAYWVSLGMYVLALMSKPTGIPVPVLLLLLDYWPIRRLSRRAVLEKMPFFAVGGVFIAITLLSQGLAGGVRLTGEYGPMRAPLIICHNIIFYLYKIVWPVNLSSHYPFPEPFNLSQPMVLWGVIGTCVLIAALIISTRRTRALLTGWLFFFVAIFPTLGVIGFTIVIASDKYVYLPAVGLLLTLSWFLMRLWGSAGKVRNTGSHSPGSQTQRRAFGVPVAVKRAAVVVLVIVIAVLEAVATRRYLVHWQDSESLWRRMVSVAPQAHIPHRGLAYVLLYNGKVDEAMNEYRQAVRLRPNDAVSLHGLGMTFMAKNETDQAIAYYNKSLMLKGDNAEAHSDLGIALLQTGKTGQAIKHLTESVRLKPNSLLGLNNLAWVLATQAEAKFRNPSEAVRLAKRACEVTDYKRPEMLDTLAAAYASAGRFDEAVKIAEKAVALATSEEGKVQIEPLRARLALYRQHKPYYEPPHPPQP